MQWQFWIIQTLNSVAFGGLLFLLSSGFSLIFGLMRIPNLAHGAFFMLGAYFGYTLLRLNLHFWLAAIAGGLGVGLLGILKAGAAYLPLDPGYPPDRLGFMLADAQAPVLLTEEALLARMPEFAGNAVCMDRDRATIAAQPVAAPRCDVDDGTLAYVIYTSGSTGTPKGVMVTHGNVARLFPAIERWLSFDSSDTWTCFHSIAFDFSVWEIWGALLYGGRLVVVPHGTTRSPDAFHELLRREHVTILNQTPSAFRQLIAAEPADADPAALALRYVIFGGEALDQGDDRLEEVEAGGRRGVIGGGGPRSNERAAATARGRAHTRRHRVHRAWATFLPARGGSRRSPADPRRKPD